MILFFILYKIATFHRSKESKRSICQRNHSHAWSSKPTSVALIYPQKTGGCVSSKRTTFDFVNTQYKHLVDPKSNLHMDILYAGLFSSHKNTQTDFISDLQCSNKHKQLIHTSNLSLHDYLGSAPLGIRGTIFSAAMTSAYLLLYDQAVPCSIVANVSLRFVD